jgi:capsular exopolysaccharide synthesis family protein
MPEQITDQNISTETDPLTLSDIWNIVYRTKLSIFIITLAVFAFGIAYISLATKEYEATAVLLVDPSERNLQMESVTPSSLVNDQALIPSQIEVLKSRELMRDVLWELGILSPKDAEFMKDKLQRNGLTLGLVNTQEEADNLQMPQTEWSKRYSRGLSINYALSNLDVSQIEKSRAIEINYLFPDPELATAITNTLTEKYISQQQEWEFQSLFVTNQWLEERVSELREEITTAQQEIAEYRKETGLVDSRGSELIEQDISEQSKKLTEARARLAEAEAKLEEFSSGDYSAAPSVLKSPLIQRLQDRAAARRDELANLRGELGAQHPEVIAAEASLNEVMSQIREEEAKVSEGIRNQIQVARDNVNRLEARLADLKDEYNRANRASVQLSSLQRETETNQELLEMLTLRLKQVQSQVEERLQEAKAVVISRASVPDKPAKPNVLLILAGSVIAGLGLGVAYAIGKDQFEDSVFNGKQLQRITKAPNISLVPKMKMKGKSPKAALAEYAMNAPQSLYAESLRYISTYIQLHIEKQPQQRVFNFLSALSNEGKSTVVASLGRLMASEGMKVLVIDCDIRRAVLTDIFGLRARDGLGELLTKTASLQDAIVQDELSGVHIIGTGQRQDNHIISRKKNALQEIVKELSGSYDVILIDSPPLLSVSDTMLLAHTAKNIVCVRWKRTKLKQITYVLNTLKRLDCPLFGTIITFVDIRKSSVYSYIDSKYYSNAKPATA